MSGITYTTVRKHIEKLRIVATWPLVSLRNPTPTYQPQFLPGSSNVANDGPGFLERLVIVEVRVTTEGDAFGDKCAAHVPLAAATGDCQRRFRGVNRTVPLAIAVDIPGCGRGQTEEFEAGRAAGSVGYAVAGNGHGSGDIDLQTGIRSDVDGTIAGYGYA